MAGVVVAGSRSVRLQRGLAAYARAGDPSHQSRIGEEQAEEAVANLLTIPG